MKSSENHKMIYKMHCSYTNKNGVNRKAYKYNTWWAGGQPASHLTSFCLQFGFGFRSTSFACRALFRHVWFKSFKQYTKITILQTTNDNETHIYMLVLLTGTSFCKMSVPARDVRHHRASGGKHWKHRLFKKYTVNSMNPWDLKRTRDTRHSPSMYCRS